MKTPSCKHFNPLMVSMLAVAALWLWSIPLNRVLAADPAEKGASQPIRITADKLEIDNAAHAAVFSDNVTAIQGGTKINADRLTIIYKAKSGSGSNWANDIERLEAHGHVRIFFDNRLAVSNQAVYIIEERKLILEGPGSKIISDQDEIVGNKIVFNRNTGHMVLEGDGRNQVEAVIHSDQRGLN